MLQTPPISPQDRRRNLSVRDFQTARICFKSGKFILQVTEVIHHRGPWRNLDQVEYVTLELVDWFNNRRLLEPIGNIPPAEFELMYYRQQDESAVAA